MCSSDLVSKHRDASEHGKDKNDRQDDGLRIREVSKRNKASGVLGL